GIRLLSGLWRQFRNGEIQDEDLAKAIAGSLETNLLQVTLTDRAFTFTTVVNSRYDPELEAAVKVEVGLVRDGWSAVILKMDGEKDELIGLTKKIEGLSDEIFGELRRTLADMRKTISGWTQTPAVALEEEKPKPEPQQESDRGLEYRIFLFLEGVA